MALTFAAILGVVTGLVVLLAGIFWVWMLVDAALRAPREGHVKLKWVLLIIFLNILGALLYYVMQRPKNVTV